MTQTPTENIVEIKPAPSIYTVLLIVAILALVAGIGVAGHRLMSAPPAGYGLRMGDLFTPYKEQPPAVDTGRVARPGRAVRRPRKSGK